MNFPGILALDFLAFPTSIFSGKSVTILQRLETEKVTHLEV